MKTCPICRGTKTHKGITCLTCSGTGEIPANGTWAGQGFGKKNQESV